MRPIFICLILLIPFIANSANDDERKVINLNGTWQFDQTVNAFPPAKFTRTIPVPGLIHLAVPKIADYDKFFKRADKVEAKEQHNLYNIDYTPRYSWYRKMVFIPKELEGKDGMITIKKSQYVTQVFVNGIDLGISMACYTPVEFPLAKTIKYGAENEILVKVGDRVWLPSEAAGGTDKEKEHYLPGIWDDVLLSFTGNVRINRLLVLPSVAGKKITVKALIRNFKPAQIFYGDAMNDSVTVEISIAEKLTGKIVATKSGRFSAKRDNLSEVMLEIPVPKFTNWSPEKPFLYIAKTTLRTEKGTSDEISKQFGMRDFYAKREVFLPER
jgi:beta-galactosidase